MLSLVDLVTNVLDVTRFDTDKLEWMNGQYLSALPADVAVRRISRFSGLAVTDDCPYRVGSVVDYFVGGTAPEPGCEPPELRDPQPHLPGRPVFPGQPRVPRPEDYLDNVTPRGGQGAN